MTSKIITLKKALDTRQAALFVQTASKFKSIIKISVGDINVNAKSLMCIISLGLSDGKQATIIAEGEDENSAVEEVTAVLL